MDDSQVRSLRQSIYEELQSEHGRAQARLQDKASGIIDSAINLFTGVDEGLIAQWQGQLNQAARMIARLSDTGDLTRSLELRAISWEDWKAQAHWARQQIQVPLESMGSVYRAGRFWDEVVLPTAETIDRYVPNPQEFLDVLPWAVAGIIALVIAYLVFTVKGALA